MFSSKLVVLVLLLAASDRFTANALSRENKELLKIASDAADKTFDQETLHENISIESENLSDDIEEVAVVRVQQKNAAGDRDVYAIVSYNKTYWGFPLDSYVMDELLLNGVAWGRLVEGEYDLEDLPKDWFKLKDEFIPNLHDDVLDHHDRATGKRVKASLLEENVLSIEEIEGSTPDTRCFYVTPRNCLQDMLAKFAFNNRYARVNNAEVIQTFCVEGGFLVKHVLNTTASGYDTLMDRELKKTTISSNVLSKFGEPVEIPDPTKPAQR